ncbi:Pinin/SDK/memA domain protein [Taphrina deformans PYCC 5710]|uniref:Pinin/SDK/memA domain protein n=1 Tax=Taphrina deformans (strain PYCC 5710 / ATCC 11124 / CBS 356.35 / IMI 108563 / JCM 9778 / NBRC 8474) TaxID=1097556 RepID=R4XDE0_TAPDE|nr:Pinin/SDK/memA domain protein [Taphrina deformans PYCC 5710]|eukprot:CCG81359.1 Pinin/SDK/memA domain protein [Taphrina deformans PYCC 5710]
MVDPIEDNESPRLLDDHDEQGEISNKRKQSDLDEPRKRVRAETLAEDKKRGKRLFGSLLGTLGGIKKEASSAKSQEKAARQAELEERQLKRLREANEEIARKQAEANAARKQRQQEREILKRNERIESFHAHQVLLANHLMTTAEPPLCYRPWELTKEQGERIEAQVQKAKEEQSKAMALLDGRGTAAASCANDLDRPKDSKEDVAEHADVQKKAKIEGQVQQQSASQQEVEPLQTLHEPQEDQENIQETAEPAAEDGIAVDAQDSSKTDSAMIELDGEAKAAVQNSTDAERDHSAPAVTDSTSEDTTNEALLKENLTREAALPTKDEPQQSETTQEDTATFVSAQQLPNDDNEKY